MVASLSRGLISTRHFLFWLSVVFMWLSFMLGFTLWFFWTSHLSARGTGIPLEWNPFDHYYVNTYYVTGFYSGIMGYLFGGVLAQKLGRRRTIVLSLSCFALILSMLGISHYYRSILFITPLVSAMNLVFYLAMPSLASQIGDLVFERRGISFGIFATMFSLSGFFGNPWTRDLTDMLFELLSKEIVDFGVGSLIVAMSLSIASLAIWTRFLEGDKPRTRWHEANENRGLTPNRLACIRMLLIVIFALTLVESLLWILPDRDLIASQHISTYALYVFASLAGGALAERFERDLLLLLIIPIELLALLASSALPWAIFFLVGLKMPIYYLLLTDLSPQRRASGFLAIGAVTAGVAVLGLIFILFTPLSPTLVTRGPLFLPLLVCILILAIPPTLKLRKGLRKNTPGHPRLHHTIASPFPLHDHQTEEHH